MRASEAMRISSWRVVSSLMKAGSCFHWWMVQRLRPSVAATAVMVWPEVRSEMAVCWREVSWCEDGEVFLQKVLGSVGFCWVGAGSWDMESGGVGLG